MAKNKWMDKLRKREGAILEAYNPFSRVIRTPSPSVNFSFGKGGGLPGGYSVAMFGPPGGGKTLLLNATIGQYHRDYPEGIAVKIDAEFREDGQLSPADYARWGIDPDRLITYQDNRATIFDYLANDISGMCDEGAPIGLIGIDSMNALQGRRFMNQDTIMTQQMGDEALTIQTGLKMVLPHQRRHKWGLFMTAHVRAEMDALEQKRGNKVRMAASFGLQHHTEYFLYIERNRNKDSKKDILGKEFLNNNVGDVQGNADTTAHKIHTVMKKNSMGVAGRHGEFTLDYTHGIVNVHEEVFMLGVNRGIIEKPNQQTYAFDGKEFRGKPAMIAFLKEHPEAQEAITKELLRKDNLGLWDLSDKAAFEQEESSEATDGEAEEC